MIGQVVLAARGLSGPAGNAGRDIASWADTPAKVALLFVGGAVLLIIIGIVAFKIARDLNG